jgi:hypothetical protein
MLTSGSDVLLADPWLALRRLVSGFRLALEGVVDGCEGVV